MRVVSVPGTVDQTGVQIWPAGWAHLGWPRRRKPTLLVSSGRNGLVGKSECPRSALEDHAGLDSGFICGSVVAIPRLPPGPISLDGFPRPAVLVRLPAASYPFGVAAVGVRRSLAVFAVGSSAAGALLHGLPTRSVAGPAPIVARALTGLVGRRRCRNRFPWLTRACRGTAFEPCK